MDKEIFCELLNPVNTEAYSVKNLSLFPLLFRNIVLCFISVKSIFALNSRNKCFTYPAYFFQNPPPFSLPTQPNPTYHQSCTAKTYPTFRQARPTSPTQATPKQPLPPHPLPKQQKTRPTTLFLSKGKARPGIPPLFLSQAQSRPILPIRHRKARPVTLPRYSKT